MPMRTPFAANLLSAALGVASIGCDKEAEAPAVPAPEPEPAVTPSPTDTKLDPIDAPHPSPHPQPDPTSSPAPAGIPPRVDPTRPVVPSPFAPLLEAMLASPPSEPVPEASAGDPAAWAKAGRRSFRKKHYTEAIRAYAQAARLEPKVWRHPFDIARAAARMGDLETAKLALVHSYLLDFGPASDAAYDHDLEPIWREPWFVKLGVGKLSEVLGNPTDWQAHGVRVESVTVRFLVFDYLRLQIHADADALGSSHEKDRIVWATSCKQGDRVYGHLGAMGYHWDLDYEPVNGWNRPAAVDYSPSIALLTEPEACEFRFYHLPPGNDTEPLAAAPVWMADFCWTRSKPYEVGMAREGRCDFPRTPGPAAPFEVEACSVVEGKGRDGALALDETFDLVLGQAAGRWQTLGVATTCRCAAGGCKETRRMGRNHLRQVRDENLWFVESGERARLRVVAELPARPTFSECEIEVGTREPSMRAGVEPWSNALDVVARFCHRGGVTTVGRCG